MDSVAKILIVDDIEDNLSVLNHDLEEINAAVFVATNGKDAIKIATKKDLDLILLDISMPEMDGFETIKILKENRRTSNVAVIFLTALSATEDMVRGFQLGAVDFITKPFNRYELLSRVNTHLDLKKSRDIIDQQKFELEEKNNFLEIQNFQMEEQNASIISSINYAKVIQDAVLPNLDFFKQFFSENFIIYYPKDIVSGDFYWTKQIYNKIILAAADCTGHGVPGAFMSMMGIAYLSEIFDSLNTNNIKANTVLNMLRRRVKMALHQDRRKDTASDGMDISLCIIDLESKKMNYAGANSPLYLIRKNEDTGKNELTAYQPDKMPIAVHLKEAPFTNKEIQLQTDDQIYMFSDGYYDQFGGELNRKFQKKRFREMLLENSHKAMDIQKQILEDTFSSWKQEQDQVDDVLIICVKIPESYGNVHLF